MPRLSSALIALALLASAVTGSSQATARQEATPASSGCPATSDAENAAIVARWYDEVLNGHDASVLDEILAEEVEHDAGAFPDEPGPRVIIEALLGAFPDISYQTDEPINAGGIVVIRWTATGTHTGEFQGHAPTGKTATWTGINIFEIKCGRIAAITTELDALGRLEQLGLLPGADAAATPAP
jgi:steroid delta-isomerase-like uncharacterized protein